MLTFTEERYFDSISLVLWITFISAPSGV